MDTEQQNQTTIIEKIVCASEGQLCQAGQVVKLRIWRDGQAQQASVLGSYQIGANELNPNVESVVVQMRVGDAWKIQTPHKITGDLEKLNITVVALEKSTIGLPLASANARAEEFKKQGNATLKQKKQHDAISIYKKGYQLIQFCCDKEAVEIRLSLMSNIALATLRSNRFRECLEWCQKHLTESMEPNQKILYREISAYKGIRQWEKAEQKVGKALLLFQGDKQAINQFQALKQAIEREQKQEMAKQKKVYTNMFGF